MTDIETDKKNYEKDRKNPVFWTRECGSSS
jgi:hypothetical protein